MIETRNANNWKNYFLGHFCKCHSETLPKMGHCSGWTSSMISPFGALPNIPFLWPGTHKFSFFKHSAMQTCCFVSAGMARSCSWSDLTALFLLRISYQMGKVQHPKTQSVWSQYFQCWQRRRTSKVLYNGDVTPDYCPGRESYDTMDPTPFLFSGVGPAIAREEGWHWKGSSSPLVIDLGVLQR